MDKPGREEAEQCSCPRLPVDEPGRSPLVGMQAVQGPRMPRSSGQMQKSPRSPVNSGDEGGDDSSCLQAVAQPGCPGGAEAERSGSTCWTLGGMQGS